MSHSLGSGIGVGNHFLRSTKHNGDVLYDVPSYILVTLLSFFKLSFKHCTQKKGEERRPQEPVKVSVLLLGGGIRTFP